MASHGSDTPTSPRAVLHHKDTILCTFMHTTILGQKFVKFFGGFLENLKNQKDILKLTDLYLFQIILLSQIFDRNVVKIVY